MEATIALCVFYKTFALFSDAAREEIIILLGLGEVIMIHEIITCVVWRVDIYHLYLAHIGILEQLQHFQIVTLNI